MNRALVGAPFPPWSAPWFGTVQIMGRDESRPTACMCGGIGCNDAWNGEVDHERTSYHAFESAGSETTRQVMARRRVAVTLKVMAAPAPM